MHRLQSRRAFSPARLGEREVVRLHRRERMRGREKIVSYPPTKVTPRSRQSAEQRLTSPLRAGTLIHTPFIREESARLDSKIDSEGIPASLLIKIPVYGLRRLWTCARERERERDPRGCCVFAQPISMDARSRGRTEMRQVIGEFWRRRLFTGVRFIAELA